MSHGERALQYYGVRLSRPGLSVLGGVTCGELPEGAKLVNARDVLYRAHEPSHSIREFCGSAGQSAWFTSVRSQVRTISRPLFVAGERTGMLREARSILLSIVQEPHPSPRELELCADSHPHAVEGLLPCPSALNLVFPVMTITI